MVRAVYNPNYFHFDSLLPYLSLAWLNIVFKLEYHSRWCLQDRCKLPWHGGDQQNAVHSWSGEVSAPHMYLFIHTHTHTHSTDILCHTSSSPLWQCFMPSVWSWPPWAEKSSSAWAVCADCAFLQRAQIQNWTNVCSLVYNKVHPWG